MKHIARISRLQRDMDLRLAARRILGAHRGRVLTFERLVDLTIASPAPSYYLSSTYAVRMLSLYRNGHLPSTVTPLRRMMWDELEGRVQSTRRHYRLQLLSTAVDYVLATGNASRFYVCRDTVRRALSRRTGILRGMEVRP